MNSGASVAVASGVIFYLVLLGGIIFLALRWSRRIMEKKSDGFRREIERLGGRAGGEGEPGGLYRGTETRYEVGGQTLFLKSYYVSRDYVRVNLRVETGPLPWIVAYPEGAVERFGKAVGLNREVQLGDREFDDAVYVDTIEADEKVKRALGAPEIRRTIVDLLAMGFKVQFSDRGIEVFQIVYAMTAPDASRVRDVLPLIAQLSKAVPSFAGETLKKAPRFPALVGGLVVVSVVSAGVAGAFIASGAVDRTLESAHQAIAFLLVGGGLWLLFGAGLVLSIRGRSSSLRLVLVALFISMFTMPLGGGALSLWLNQQLDGGPVEPHAATVKKLTRKGRIVRVSSWRPGRTTETTSTRYDVFRTLKVGDEVTVRVRPGAFGWPWTEPLTRTNDADAR